MGVCCSSFARERPLVLDGALVLPNPEPCLAAYSAMAESGAPGADSADNTAHSNFTRRRHAIRIAVLISVTQMVA